MMLVNDLVCPVKYFMEEVPLLEPLDDNILLKTVGGPRGKTLVTSCMESWENHQKSVRADCNISIAWMCTRSQSPVREPKDFSVFREVCPSRHCRNWSN